MRCQQQADGYPVRGKLRELVDAATDHRARQLRSDQAAEGGAGADPAASRSTSSPSTRSCRHAAHVPGARIRHLRDGVHHLCVRPRRRQAVHRDPGVRDPQLPSLGDVLSTPSPASRTPKDLEGRKVGVNRGYTVTTGLWARGILQSEYGVDLDKITWIPTDDEHVAEFKAPAERRLPASAANRCATCCCPARSMPRSARSA